MSSSPATGSTRPLWVAVALLLAVGIVMPLLVGTYDSDKPALFGFPFFYWFQFLLIPVVSLLTYVAFRISETATHRDRESRGQNARPAGEAADR